MYFRISLLFVLIFAFSCTAIAQTETVSNAYVVEMTKVGLDKELIKEKINVSKATFDISTAGLIELRKAGVDNEVIKFMMTKVKEQEAAAVKPAPVIETKPEESAKLAPGKKVPTPREALLSARTLAIEKSSLNPSRQALEKELLKRKEWPAFNLSLVRYKEEADLYVEIGFVAMSVITHRYVYRVYDRRSGIVIAAGETTSWGSLAENLAREISKKLKSVADAPAPA